MLWMRSCSSALAMRNLKISVGMEAKGGTSAPTTSKFRSGILISFYRPGFRSYPLKKSVNSFPGFATPAQAFPGHANQSHKLVTGVNRYNVMLACVLHPIDE